MSTPRKPQYAIIGGGISGLTLAIALHHRGLSVTIYEQASKFGEIGAGVGFTDNAIQAMRICHEGIEKAFRDIVTFNQWPSKENVWFDVYNAHVEPPDYAFTVKSKIGQAGVHRAHFLDELVKLLPEDIAHFGKRFQSLEKGSDGRWQIKFEDGSSATADAVIGCDGIKSSVRKWMYGADYPCSAPTYTHKYAYRALVPMKEAIDAIGEEKAMNACLHMGQGGHFITFPVDRGRKFNLVAFFTSKQDWTDHNKLTKPAHRDEALRDFAAFGSDVQKLLQLAQKDLDVWAIFHLGDNPLPKYHHSTILLVGDAAHASSPHHGSGAGMCIEDSAVLAEMLSLPEVGDSQSIELAFAKFDELRRERGNALVVSSVHQGDLYEWSIPGIESDFAKIKNEMETRNSRIMDVNVQQMCDEAKNALQDALPPR